MKLRYIESNDMGECGHMPSIVCEKLVSWELSGQVLHETWGGDAAGEKRRDDRCKDFFLGFPWADMREEF